MAKMIFEAFMDNVFVYQDNAAQIISKESLVVSVIRWSKHGENGAKCIEEP